MPTLDFKGKSHIYAHHLTVPYRPLLPDYIRSKLEQKTGGGQPDSGGVPPVDGNLIIHGDNLHALKALLPTYAGRVKCIYIDPPYNTGSQAWVYNDNVNSPMMRQWLSENKPIEDEDLERHDKWLCMMWPRLHLLRDLLSEDGVIFVSIDDHEQWRLLGMMHEIFGPGNFIATLSFVHHLGALPGKWLTTVTEYVQVFSKNSSVVKFNRLPTDDDPEADWDRDEVGYYKEGYNLIKGGSGASRTDRPSLYFPIFVSSDRTVAVERGSSHDHELLPTRTDGTDGRWRWSKDRVRENPSEILVKPHRTRKFQLIAKQRPTIGDVFATKPRSLWYKPQYQSPHGTNMLRSIFEDGGVFDYPKAVPFVSDLLRFANVGPDDIVLDSFAGSGTTAHAVLALNKEDGGNRRFILVECEDYADTITAERVRRVMDGVPSAKDAALREGYGGEFTYCTLGEPITVEGMLTGESMPAFDQLAAYLINCATGQPVAASEIRTPDHADFDTETSFVYETDRQRFHLFYRPSTDWLASNDGALNSVRSEKISADAKQVGKSAVVFGPVRYMNSADLHALGITFCQLPYELTAVRAQLA